MFADRLDSLAPGCRSSLESLERERSIAVVMGAESEHSHFRPSIAVAKCKSTQV